VACGMPRLDSPVSLLLLHTEYPTWPREVLLTQPCSRGFNSNYRLRHYGETYHTYETT
jgi:hypothetical protein